MNSQNADIMITVFTPTYNRAYSLPRLYDSLKAQTFRDFEWLIIDDGSTDDTERVVSGWKMKMLSKLTMLSRVMAVSIEL